MMQYFEFQEENVSCFLEISLEDRIVRTRSGQKGTHGIATEKVFRDPELAAEEYDRIVQEKKVDDTYYFRLGDDYRL